MDHQGIHFKTSDRKSMAAKSMLTEIETLYREQRERHQRKTGSNVLPSNRYQFDFAFKDRSIFGDVERIIFAFLESSLSLSSSDEKRIKDFLVNFLYKFFNLDPADGSTDVEMNDRPSYAIYTNTLLYVFYRLYQVFFFIYS